MTEMADFLVSIKIIGMLFLATSPGILWVSIITKEYFYPVFIPQRRQEIVGVFNRRPPEDVSKSPRRTRLSKVFAKPCGGICEKCFPGERTEEIPIYPVTNVHFGARLTDGVT